MSVAIFQQAALASYSPASAMSSGASAATAAPRKRLRTKSTPSAVVVRDEPCPELDACLARALSVECDDDDLAHLAKNARRKYVHWTHVRTRDASHVQPSAFTRQAFYAHLATCYAEAYPLLESRTGSILQFGVVASEKHAASQSEQHRDEHKHAATASTCQHRCGRSN